MYGMIALAIIPVRVVTPAPLMKAVLFDTSTHSDHEDILFLIATDLYDKICKECKLAARYGHKGILSLDVSSFTRYYRWIPRGCEDRVLSNLHILLTRENLLRSSHGTIVDLSWIPLPTEEKMVKITTRDLIKMGIYDTTTYGEILRHLRTALAKNEVYDTEKAQYAWVKERFARKK
jgi:hypothetical protein